MKLKLSYQKEPRHSDLVSCVGWANSSELFSVGDDHQILKWDIRSGETTRVATLHKDTYVTKIHWFPTATGHKKATSHSQSFVLACTNGRFLLVSSGGRVEKAVEAHNGAVLGALWSHDGTALITHGEDGALKVWSRVGMLRTSLAQSGSPVYSTSWSPESDQVLYTSGKSLVIKPLQPSTKPVQWKAHDGIVLTVDWSPANDTIISGAEDRKYKVWDSYGRCLYTSFLHDCPITALSWSPDGGIFAVGGFNTLRLCDETGWSHCLEKPSCGTVLCISWSSDGTQLAGACGGGQVVFGEIIDRCLEWHNLEAVVSAGNAIKVRDVTTDAEENLELHDHIIKVSLGWGHLIVTTPLHGYIYNSRNWTTPATIDLNSASVTLIKQADRHFLMADSVAGLQIISYEGRQVSTVKYPRHLTALLSPGAVSVCGDTIAIRDKKEEKFIHVYDAATGKELRDGQPFQHHVDILCVSLSNAGPSSTRLLVCIDRNHDLLLTPARRHSPTGGATITLSSMVTSVCWNDGTNMLAAVVDSKLHIWYHPAAAYADRDLLAQTVVQKEGSNFFRSPHLLQFIGTCCTLRRNDGALITTSVSPFPAVLHQHGTSSKWEAAIKLCRFVKDPALWACLAAMATSARDLNTAEIAYAAINEVEKVHYITEIKALPTAERRNAELALFCREPQQAESLYLQAGLIYRAIQLNIDLFKWERALELALKHKTHVDTVLAFREKYLSELHCQENFKSFTDCAGKVKINWEMIRAKIEKEEEKNTY